MITTLAGLVAIVVTIAALIWADGHLDRRAHARAEQRTARAVVTEAEQIARSAAQPENGDWP